MIPVTFNLQIAGAETQTFLTPNFIQSANAGIQFVAYILDSSGNAMNIIGAAGLTLAFQLPDQTTITRTASFLSNGIDGAITYSTVSTDISESGLWAVQAQFSIGTSYFTTQWGQFKVGGNL